MHVRPNGRLRAREAGRSVTDMADTPGSGETARPRKKASPAQPKAAKPEKPDKPDKPVKDAAGRVAFPGISSRTYEHLSLIHI